MSRNRLIAFGEKISIRLQPAQSYRLKKHEMRVGEPIGNIINRQLKRLHQAISEGTQPAEPTPALGSKSVVYRFRPELDLVEPFIGQMRSQRGWENDRVAVECLLPWSCELPIVVPLLSAEEMYQNLFNHFDHSELIPIRSALLAVCDRCSLEQAKAWLWELSEAGEVVLRLPRDKHLAGEVVRLPDGRGKLYFYLELVSAK